jgi:hypothetical protein
MPNLIDSKKPSNRKAQTPSGSIVLVMNIPVVPLRVG